MRFLPCIRYATRREQMPLRFRSIEHSSWMNYFGKATGNVKHVMYCKWVIARSADQQTQIDCENMFNTRTHSFQGLSPRSQICYAHLCHARTCRVPSGSIETHCTFVTLHGIRLVVQLRYSHLHCESCGFRSHITVCRLCVDSVYVYRF